MTWKLREEYWSHNIYQCTECENEAISHDVTDIIPCTHQPQRYPLGINFEPVESDDDIYTIEEFQKHVESGGFIDYDGFGNYAYEKKKSNLIVKPSQIKAGNIRKQFTHVVWYNR